MGSPSAIKSDFDKLLKQFKACDSVRFEYFAEVWKNLKMSYIMSGIETTFEMRQFIEDCMRVALEYCDPERELQDRMGGLYILYALYYKQPIDPPARIRILANQWNDMKILLQEMKGQQHLDAEYIFTKLRGDHAFQLAATSCRKMLIKPKQTKTDEDRQEAVKPTADDQEPSILSDIMEPDTIGQLSALHEQYHRMKCYLAGQDAAKPDVSLSCINNNLVQNITKAVAGFEEYRKRKLDPSKVRVRRRKDSGTTTTSESEGDSDYEAWRPKRKKMSKHGELRASLKEKAFSMPVSGRYSLNKPSINSPVGSLNVSDSGADESDVMTSPVKKQSDTEDEEYRPGTSQRSRTKGKGAKGRVANKMVGQSTNCEDSPGERFERGGRVRRKGIKTRGMARGRGGATNST